MYGKDEQFGICLGYRYMGQDLAFYTICLLCLCSGLGLALAEQSSDLTENASLVLDAIQWQNSSCSNNTALPIPPALAEPEELNATTLNKNVKKVWANPSMGPGKAILISPKGMKNIGTVSFVWSPVDGSTSYHLWIDRAGSHVFDHWYLASEVTAGSICSAMPSKVLDKGTYSWKVQTRGDEGGGAGWKHYVKTDLMGPGSYYFFIRITCLSLNIYYIVKTFVS